jgi:1,4-dihydroxy-6-naphthoate synthase
MAKRNGSGRGIGSRFCGDESELIMRIRIGISTCPNDTFAFHALMTGAVKSPGIEWEFELLDIEELNRRLFAESFDVAKASFHAALLLADQMWVLPSGSALGFGVGPLLLAARDNSRPDSCHRESLSETQLPIVLCPGQHTTATLLYQLFYPQTGRITHCVFSDIMPRLQCQEADFGVCIHEGRFTWQESDLYLVEDLGQRWEQTTASPLPLGGILASRHLDRDLLNQVQTAIHDSIRWAQNHPDETLPTMRRYAQEFDDRVLMQHVELYVNQWTLDLGDLGNAALEKLRLLATQAGIIEQQEPFPALVFRP